MGVLVDKKPGDDPAVQSLEWERFTPEDTAEIIAEPPVTSLDREHFALEIVEGDFDGGVEIAIGEEGSGLRAVHRYRKTGGAHTLWTSPIGFRVEGGVPVPRFKSTSSALVTYHTEEDGLSVRSFDGASCIHPSVVALLNEGFSPSPDEIAQARRVVKALEDAEAQGLGAVALDGRMIDKPVADRARLLLARAGRWV